MSSVDVLQARPQTIAIEITSKCNLRCSYCDKSDPILEALPGANADMSDDVISSVYYYCKDVGIKSVSLSGIGETTMTKGWYTRITKFLDDPEISAQMVSNFVRPFEDDDLAALVRLDELAISIDSSDLAMMRKLRSKADLRTITYNIMRLQQKIREIGRGPTITVNCTLCRDNIGHIIGLAGFCRELRVDRLIVTDVMVTGKYNPKMPQTLDGLTDDEVVLLAEQIAGAEDRLAGSSTALQLREELRARIDTVVAGVRQGAIPTAPAAHFHRTTASSACRQPWDLLLVGANGNMVPCCGGTRDGPVGNLTRTTLPEILDGETYRAIRASILDGQPILPCHRCSFARQISFSELRREIEAWHGLT